MNNLDDTVLALLVQQAEGESADELFGFLQKRYDARLQDAEFGPKYKVGPTYVYAGQRFSKVCTFAGSLVLRIIFDTRKGKFERPIIYRDGSDESMRLLSPGGPESRINEHALANEIPNETNC